MIVFGPRAPCTDVFCAKETKRIIEVTRQVGVKRLICQTGAMIGDYKQNRSFLFEVMSNKFRESNPAGYQDRVRQEEFVKQSGIDWTIVKPPRLTNSRRKKKIVACEDTLIGLLSSISRYDLALFILHELVTPRFIRKTVFIKS